MKKIFKKMAFVVLVLGISAGTIRAHEALASLDKSSKKSTMQAVEESKETVLISKKAEGIVTVKDPKDEPPEEKIDNHEEAKEEAPSYNGLILTLNDQWSLKFSGQLNAYFTNSWVTPKGSENYTTQAIQNGLLPASLMVSPIYKPTDNITITGTFGLWFGISTSGLNNDEVNEALGFSAVDIRNVSINTETPIGSFLIGRDFGRFGLDAILNEISILGVGASYSFINPAHTTLSGIGYGYIYVDRLVQINYTTPTFLGTNITIGIYDAFQDNENNNLSVGFHAKLATNQKISDNINFYLSGTFLLQERKSINNNVFGGDVFLKFDAYGLSLAGYFYGGIGIGDVGILIGGIKDDKALTSLGGYGQISYTFNLAMPLTLGVHYAVSTLEGIEDQSRRITGSLALAVHSNLILRAEFTNQTENITLGALAPAANIIAIGATFAF